MAAHSPQPAAETQAPQAKPESAGQRQGSSTTFRGARAGRPAALFDTSTVTDLQRSIGNREVTTLLRTVGDAGLGRARATIQRSPVQRATVQRATPQELQDVVDLMPITPAIDNLFSVVESECTQWTSWRSKLSGPVPGGAAFEAMTEFKTKIRASGFDWTDARIQRTLRRRVAGNNKQLLTEMCSFAIGTGTSSKGDSVALAGAFGATAKLLNHRYTLKIGYSIGVKGKIGIGVGYTYRSAGIFYENDFGMKYNKPLNMRSLVASLGPGAEAKIKGGKELASVGAVGLDGSGSISTVSYWEPSDWETDFTVTKVAGGAQAGLKFEAKLLEVVRVTSDKHGPQLFNLMEGQTVATEASGELGVGVGAGVDLEKGKMVGGDDVGNVTVETPAIEKAKEIAQKNGLVAPDKPGKQFMVIGATVLTFDTGNSFPIGNDQTVVLPKFAAFINAWAQKNPGGTLKVDIVGSSSPRWRHPKKGQIADNLNQQLSQTRADVVKELLNGYLAELNGVSCEVTTVGCPGPVMNMDDAQAKGRGSLNAKAEGADPDANDAKYRTVSLTASGKEADEGP